MTIKRIASLLVAGLAACAFNAAAQSFPAKPMKIIIPYPPGGGIDFIGRVAGEKLSARWSQPVVVENRTGASGAIGSEAAAKSEADGYTLLVMPIDLMLNPSLIQNPRFDPLKDLAPIAVLAASTQIIAAHGGSGIKTLADLVARAKAEPGKISFSSCGNGSPGQLIGETLKARANVDMTHVPYKGCAPAVTDAVGGQVQLTIGGTGTVAQYIRSGRLNALAVASPQRDPQYGEIPTAMESGFPEVSMTNWFGLFAPAGTKPEVIEKISADLAAIYADPAFRKSIADRTLNPMFTPTAPFAKLIASDVERFRALMKQLGIKAD